MSKEPWYYFHEEDPSAWRVGWIVEESGLESSREYYETEQEASERVRELNEEAKAE